MNCLMKLGLISSLLHLIYSQNVKIWGPGLEPNLLRMPARYFFIHSSNSSLDVKISGTTKGDRHCRMWANVLNRKDDFSIVRYKLYETCSRLEIHVKIGDEHVGESPYVINEPVLTEECVCPIGDLDIFSNKWKCEIPQQLEKDLKDFDKIDFSSMRDKIIKTYDNPGAVSLCHYVIKDNKIHRKCYGKYVGFKIFMDSILLSLSRKTLLPDLEFFVNLGDWPLVTNRKFPIFSWCGSTDSYDIIMPTYEITEATLENMGRVMLDMLSVQGNVENPWEQRIPKLFWRGRDSSRERLNLIEIGKENPELFNVSLTNFFFFRDEQEKYGPKSEHVSFFKFFDYKYQLCMDGTVAAYRMPYLLAGGSLVFKQDSKYYEHFYANLQPYVHYIPVKRDISDLVEKIRWAMEHDEEAEKIAKAGQEFAVENLLPKDIFCYYASLLNEFKKRLVSQVQVLEGMEIVEHKKDEPCGCPQKLKDEL